MTPELIEDIIQAIKQQYKKDYGQLNDTAYFICGFVKTALEGMIINKQSQ